jgi:hypothetical protein
MGVFQFSFQKIGRSSKGKQQDGGERGRERMGNEALQEIKGSSHHH